MVNILDSHDTDRAVSMLANPGRGYDRDNLPGAGNPPYHNGPPSDDAYARYMLAATLQFTLPGAPMIYYGDEVGMYGGEDPYSRSPMWWPGSNGWDQIGVREDVSRHLKSLIRLRSENAALRHGSYHVVLAEDRRRLLAFERMAGDQRLLIFANAGSEQAMLQFNFPPPSDPVSTDSTEALPEVEVSGTQPATNPRVVKLTCGPLEAVVLLSRSGRQAKEILKLQFKR
jgi:glycosidase